MRGCVAGARASTTSGRARVQPGHAGRRGGRDGGRRRHRALHEHRARLLGPGVHAGGARADRADAAAAAARGARPGRRRHRGRRTSRAAYEAGATLLVAGERDLRPRGSRAAPTAAWCKRWREPIERALELAERGRGTTHPNPVVGAVVVARTARSSARAGTSARRAARRGRRARRRRRARERRDALRDARAVRASRAHAAVRRRGRRRRDRAASSSARDDPNPRGGGGLERLRELGVEVEVARPAGARAAQNEAWRTWSRSRRPFVTLQGRGDARRPRDGPGLALGLRRGVAAAACTSCARVGRGRGRHGHGARRRAAARRARRRRRAAAAAARVRARPAPGGLRARAALGRAGRGAAHAGGRGRAVAPARGRPDARDRVPRARVSSTSCCSSWRRSSPARGRVSSRVHEPARARPARRCSRSATTCSSRDTSRSREVRDPQLEHRLVLRARAPPSASRRPPSAPGWDAYLIWDHLAFVWEKPAADPWVTLGAVAASTERILIGTGVTPVARRRPQVVAHELATLDRLAPGRVVVRRRSRRRPRRVRALRRGRGPARTRRAARRGARRDPRAALRRARRPSGRALHGRRRHARAGPEHVPIWIGGLSANARARAARFDGWFADTASPSAMTTTPGDLATMLDGICLRRRRGDGLLRARPTRAAGGLRRGGRDLVDRADGTTAAATSTPSSRGSRPALAFGVFTGHRPRARTGRLVRRRQARRRGRRSTPAIGDSVSVDGVCLTVVEVDGRTLAFDAVARDARARARAARRPRRTSSRRCAPASRSAATTSRATSTASAACARSSGEARLARLVDAPPELLRYCVEKGSIAVDGVSLTIAALDDERLRGRARPAHARGDDARSDCGPATRSTSRSTCSRSTWSACSAPATALARDRTTVETTTRRSRRSRRRSRTSARASFVVVVDAADRENEGDLDDRRAVRDARGDQLHGDARARPDLPLPDRGALRRARAAADGASTTRRRSAPPSPSRSRRARASPPASPRRTARTRSRSRSTRPKGRTTSSSPATSSRCARGPAACSSAPARPRPPSTSRGSPG